MKRLICIGGPTGCGKTDLAISLAESYKCEILSFDSRQLYTELSIGVARPTDSQLAAVRHHLISSQSIYDHFSVGDFVIEAKRVLGELFKKDDTVVAVGGTGFYLHKLLSPLDEIPAVPDHVREEIQFEFEVNGLPWLQEFVSTQDPVFYSMVDVQNHSRLQRAAEVIRSTGQPFSQFQKGNYSQHFTDIEVHKFALLPERTLLYDRINSRVEEMLQAGLEKEARELYKDKGLKALATVGYTELFDYFEGKTSLGVAIDKIKQHSRNYAKRQYTWFRNQGDWDPIYTTIIEQQTNQIKTKIHDLEATTESGSSK
ncbi:MAG TPA: tRNA (adenosine(37)-N6)-dimethylallyltransferase MiaA [Saprospiraceae bacterium]|nr:tRNA (adenosine(37)-N6)-dimethylallyltransferase MiaA [Saprospiraceae bacterium]HQW55881.1 tRNA (adenosine(37)-N6)-dimethylallyltransferase MiaA [Saprospiraceae bacterium]